MATSVPDLVALTEVGPGAFTSRYPPLRMGNAANIGYGGCAMAFAVNAAFAGLNGYRVYSVLGHSLAGANTDEPLKAMVTPVRDSRSFATRVVQVIQDRPVLQVTVDFHRVEESLLEYSPLPPSAPFEDTLKEDEAFKWMEERSSEGHVQFLQMAFEPALRFFETRTVKNSVAAQNMYGMVKEAVTSQDHLPVTDKSSCDWWGSRVRLETPAEHMCTLIFQLDAAMAFIPLTHSKMFLDDAGACSSLDFAFRVFDEVDLNEWHLRELKTVVGSAGRTYSVARVFSRKGKLVAEMSQQSILRKPRAVM